ncbi:MAG: dockerin type I repeat-containing protein [Clostridia bacterium]|nr:dockerin type I repeat-containing protein [Clostridia bacterium]
MKKVISVILCIAMFCTFCVFAMASNGENYVNFSSTEVQFPKNSHVGGDTNGDGVVNVLDVLASLRYISGNKTGTRYDSVDVNGDGIVALSDTMLIIRHVLGYDVGLGKTVK